MSTDGPDYALLPQDLQGLARLIAHYAESDDVQRTALLEAASADELRDLTTAPEEHWDAINAFLDEYIQAEPGPHQEVALALDSFAQGAMEARYELALELDDVWRASALELTDRQRIAVERLDEALRQLSGRDNATFWTVAALQKNPDWESVRGLAREAVAALSESEHGSECR